ncbi:hypothetical protein ACN27G_01210 [Plantactinospora sp. WMMB334]|uniref:hypothetical protein n=1 Tax=Plantactinospora sp. WMMB334 TaxID=3404119 RepID=UPI003B957D4C
MEALERLHHAGHRVEGQLPPSHDPKVLVPIDGVVQRRRRLGETSTSTTEQPERSSKPQVSSRNRGFGTLQVLAPYRLYEQAVTRAARLDADVLNQVEPAGSVLGDALSALAAAVVAWRRHAQRTLPAWTLIVMFTGGRLLTSLLDDQHAGFGGRVCPQ